MFLGATFRKRTLVWASSLQEDPAEVGGMVQDHIAHLEGEDVVLKVLLQV